jgi:GntR family transcriptional repressor for pyruvate dehydrogenase complex
MLQYTSRVDKIAAGFQEKILHGELKPGERLPAERSLCAQFSVGRTTIREALKSLMVRGLVVRRGRSVIVADPENFSQPAADLAAMAVQVSIRQLYEARKLIEVRSAGWAAARATEDDIAGLRRALEPGSPNRAFHDALARAVHNPALVQIYQSAHQLFFRLPFYWKLFDESEVTEVRTRRHDLARRWHEHLLNAVAHHDVAEAEGAMFQHLDIMEKDLLARLPTADSASAEQQTYSHPMLAQRDIKEDALPRATISRQKSGAK